MVALLLGSGCALADSGAEAATDDFIDMDTPPGNCSAGTGAEPCPDPGTTGSPEGGPCVDSQDCAGGNACVAPFDGQVGNFVCEAQCVPLEFPGAWCLDDGACCDPQAVCTTRGLCVIVEGQLDDTAGDSTSGDSTGASSSGTGEPGSTGGSSSGTGAATGTTGMQ